MNSLTILQVRNEQVNKKSLVKNIEFISTRLKRFKKAWSEEELLFFITKNKYTKSKYYAY
jgi:hypothetical protein